MKRVFGFLSILALFIVGIFFISGCSNTPIEKLENDYGVIVSGGEFEKGTVLNSTEVALTSDEAKEILNVISDDYNKDGQVYIYDINITNDGESVVPDFKIKVSIPLPNEDITDCIILHLKNNTIVEEIIPTIEDGMISFETSNFSYFVVIEKNYVCTHQFGEWEVLTEPTCTKTGKKIRYCSSCKIEEVDEIAALDHDIITHEGKSPTCTEVGYEAYETCSRCDYSTYKELEALDHDITTHEGKSPTCTEVGFEAYETCSRCDYSTYKELEALDHDIITNEGKSPTCTEVGYEAYETCSRCDYSTYKELEALDHDIITNEGKSPTCTEVGYEAYETCSRCDYSTYKELEALDHDIITHEGKSPTCTKVGYEAYETCSRCDYSTYKELEVLDHEYSIITVQTYPTCETEGTQVKKCSSCGHEVTSSIAKVAHTFGEWTTLSESTCSVHGIEERSCIVCNHKEQRDKELTYHDFGEYVVTKEPTIYEEGVETATCNNCGATREYPLEKLESITITVSGGTVNRLGESLDQSVIVVGYGEVVQIVAKEYEGYTFYQWFSDGEEIIPSKTFELYATRNAYFYICFEEGLDYGSWTVEQELTCTQDGIYSRTDSKTGLKQYMISFTRGHEMGYEPVYEVEPTCTSGGRCYYQCWNCGEKEYEDVSSTSHKFSSEGVIVEEALGSKVGLKEYTCEYCGQTKTEEYIKAIFPQGNLKIEFFWDNLAYVSTADCDETHYMLDGNKYLFEIMRDSSGHSSGNYVYCYFYYEDLGEHSPVYVKRMIGDSYNPRTNCYGTNGWGIVGYVDSYDEFIKYIQSEAKGNDNGRNNSSLYDIYEKWEDIFNENGCIPESYYCSGIVEYLGYQCRVYENDGFAYYVNEDNCCLYFSGKNTNRYHSYVTSIEEITEIPNVDINFDSIKYILIDIEDGKDYNFTDQSYFQVENLMREVEIYQSSYISNREVVTGYELKDLDGNWVKIEGLECSNKTWTLNGATYMDLINTYCGGVYPDKLHIRAIVEDADLPVKVTISEGRIYSDDEYYESGSSFLGSQEVRLIPDFDEYKYNVDSWIVVVNGVETVYSEEDMYSLTITLPESGEVVARYTLKDKGKLDVTFNIIGNGSLNYESGEYLENTILDVFATPSKGYRFAGWYVQGLYFMAEGDFNHGGYDEAYLEYGEYFGKKALYSFEIMDTGTDIIITAVFEVIVNDNYIDAYITDGFAYSYELSDLHLSAIRLTKATYLYFQKAESLSEAISGWNVTEQLDEGPTEIYCEGEYSGHYVSVDSQIVPVNASAE